MQSVIDAIAPVAEHEPTIAVRVHPANISDAGLVELREVARERDLPSDCLRVWLGNVVAHEIARRASDDGEVTEPPAWCIPWHEWTDGQLSAAMAASYSWYDVGTNGATNVVLREIHRAVLSAACTRLLELHKAIERSRER
jgi:hypothetical protein